MIFTLAFIRYQNEYLLINRFKQPWQGCWNGVGGKIESKETIFESIQREICEETGLKVALQHIQYKGKVSWSPSDGSFLHLFLVDVETRLETPIKTDEGILDWKSYDWIVDFDNLGVAHNIPYFLPHMLEHALSEYHCIFEGNRLTDVKIIPLEVGNA